MFSAEEKKQLDMLRHSHECKIETHIKPVDGGFVIAMIERFCDPAGVVVAQASTTAIAKNGLEVANYLFDLYVAEPDIEPVPTHDSRKNGEDNTPEQIG